MNYIVIYLLLGAGFAVLFRIFEARERIGIIELLGFVLIWPILAIIWGLVKINERIRL